MLLRWRARDKEDHGIVISKELSSRTELSVDYLFKMGPLPAIHVVAQVVVTSYALSNSVEL